MTRHWRIWLVAVAAFAASAALPLTGAAGDAPRAPAAANKSSAGIDLEGIKRGLQRLAPADPPAAVTPAAQVDQGPLMLTLQQSIGVALAKNLGIRIAVLARESADREIPRATARFHPTTGLTATASGARSVPQAAPVVKENTQQVVPFIRQELPTGGAVLLSSDFFREEVRPPYSEQFGSAVTLSVVQPLLRGGRTYVATQSIRNAEFDAHVAKEGLKAETLRVIAQTKRAYYSALLAEKIIEVTEAAIERDKRLVEASQQLFSARLVTKRDVFSAELILAQDSARLVSARSDLDLARNAFLDVLGLPIARQVVLLDREVSFQPIPLRLDRWIELGLQNRPEIRAIGALLEKSALGILVARNAQLPQLDLVGSYGRAQTNSTLVKSLELGGDVWSVGFLFSFPLGNVAARSALAQAELQHGQLQEERAQTRRQIELEIRAAVIKLEKSVERMKALTVAIEQAKGKLEVGKAQFALGQATNLDITDAQQALLNAETDLLTAIIDYNIGLAELGAAVGEEGALPFTDS